MSLYRDQVRAAVSAVRICGPSSYAWLGRRSRPLPRSMLARLDREDCRRYLVASLQEEMYASFYCTGAPVPARRGTAAPVGPDSELCAELSGANAGRGGWESGWTVDRCDHEMAIASTPRLRVCVPLVDCRVDGGDLLASGANVSLRLPKELPALSPGFFMVVSNASVDIASSTGVVRVYWDITATGAPTLVRELTAALNAETVPFRLKLANHPALFDRCDPAVLYLEADAFRAVKPLLRDVADSLCACLRPRIPAFTLRFAPGVALAESPDAGESFGLSRCGVLAEGTVDAHERGIHEAKGRVEAAIAHFAANGVDIDAPYLDPSLSGRHVL